MKWLLVFLALGLGLGGCSHYQLGTEGALDFTSLYVAPVANKAKLPQVQAVFSTMIRNEIAKDGRVSLANSPDSADAVLEVTLVSYTREVAAVREVDTGLASKFTLVLKTTCTLRNNRTGKVFFENRPVQIQKSVFTDNGVPASIPVGDQLQAEYNVVPILGQALATEVAHAVLDVW